MLDNMIERMDDSEWHLESLTALAPFIGRETANRMARRIVQNEAPDARNVVALAPFLDHTEVDGLANVVNPSEWDWRAVTGVAPFLSRRMLSKIVTDTMERIPDAHQLIAIAPFLDRSDLAGLIQKSMDRVKRPES